MDYGCRSGHAIEIIPDSSAPVYPKQRSPPLNDQSLWATEDDYRDWNGDPSLEILSHTAYDSSQLPSRPQSRAGSEQSPNKKPRASSQGDSTCSSSSKSIAIGRMFFKTKLCGKFRTGTCPYITNCNFAHGMEELRRPPPNWQEIVASHDEGGILELREEHQIPILSSSAGMIDGQRSYKGRHCKKFYTDEGCPYGDTCSFLHDEQSKDRESVAISLSPAVGPGGYGARGFGAAGSGFIQKHFSWKTRICNKWEMSGYCPFGSKCHFAHGAAELHRHGGGAVETEGNDASSTTPDTKPGFASTRAGADAVASSTSLPHADLYHMGVPAPRSAAINPRFIHRPIQKWKGPDKINRIYGDWIDDID